MSSTKDLSSSLPGFEAPNYPGQQEASLKADHMEGRGVKTTHSKTCRRSCQRKKSHKKEETASGLLKCLAMGRLEICFLCCLGIGIACHAFLSELKGMRASFSMQS